MTLWVAQDVYDNCDFQVSEARGFLPEADPLQRLDAFPAWEAVASDLSHLINASRVREAVLALPVMDTARLNTVAEQERAMMLLSFMGHAVLRDRPGAPQSIPAQIAVPWCALAAALDRPPVLSHASVVLNNWRRIDPDGPIALGNLATLVQFHGGLDEAWFYLVTVEIEAIGARGVHHLLEAALSAERGDLQGAASHLTQAAATLAQMTTSLEKLYERCDPYIFYQRVRPFLSSLDEVEYEGVTPRRQSHHGGSAAQSSLLQSYDHALGLSHPAEPSRSYMRQMLRHMPKPHRDFIEFVGAMSLREPCTRSAQSRDAWTACVEALAAFRQRHLEVVARYVVAQAGGTSGGKGTGGTNPMVFLKQMKRDTTSPAT